jgi:transcriptional regulator with XRE-family HTH domain
MMIVGQDGGVGKTTSPAFSPARLAEARRAAGLSNAQLADAIGVRRQEVVRWQSLTAPWTPRPQLQLQLAEALGVKVADLVEQEDLTLVTLRRERGLRQADLAELARLPRSTVQALESGKIAALRPEHAQRLAGALQTSVQVVERAHQVGLPVLRRPPRVPDYSNVTICTPTISTSSVSP